MKIFQFQWFKPDWIISVWTELKETVGLLSTTESETVVKGMPNVLHVAFCVRSIVSALIITHAKKNKKRTHTQ